jgi:hypothetical protein
MNTLKTQVNEAAYRSMLTVNPGVIEALREALKNGQTARQIEKSFRKKYGDGNLTAMSTICAAYHIEAHPELLEARS